MHLPTTPSSRDPFVIAGFGLLASAVIMSAVLAGADLRLALLPIAVSIGWGQIGGL